MQSEVKVLGSISISSVISGGNWILAGLGGTDKSIGVSGLRGGGMAVGCCFSDSSCFATTHGIQRNAGLDSLGVVSIYMRATRPRKRVGSVVLSWRSVEYETAQERVH